MITTTTDIASTMTAVRMPALRTQEPSTGVSACPIAALYGGRVPAFWKDAFPGVRAWSPPV